MNWLFIITVVAMLLFTFIGLKRGLIKVAMSMLFLILTLLLVSILTPYVGGFLTKYTPLHSSIKGACVENMSLAIQDESVKLSDQLLAIEELPLPKMIRNGLIENNNSEVYSALKVDSFMDYVGGYIAKTIVNIIAYIATFVIVFIALKLLTHALDLLTELPILKGINSLGGMVLGCIQGIVFVWIFMLIITLFTNTPFGKTMFAMIDQSAFLTFMYENNILLNLFLNCYYRDLNQIEYIN